MRARDIAMTAHPYASIVNACKYSWLYRLHLDFSYRAGLDGALSLSAFQELLAEKTGVPAFQQELLAGFPPAPLRMPTDRTSTLGDLPIANGDTVVVRKKEGAAASASAQRPESAAAAAEPGPPQQSAEQLAQVQHD